MGYSGHRRPTFWRAIALAGTSALTLTLLQSGMVSAQSPSDGAGGGRIVRERTVHVRQLPPARGHDVAHAAAPAFHHAPPIPERPAVPARATARGALRLTTASVASPSIASTSTATAVASSSLPAAAASASSPTAATTADPVSPTATVEDLTHFDGLSQNGKTPSDVTMAVGPTQVLEMVNIAGAVYDKAGNQQGATFGLGTFWGANATFPTPTDPKALYDAESGHFFASILLFDPCNPAPPPTGSGCTTSQNSDVRLAISGGTTADTWTIYDVESNTSNTLFDQPKLGVNSDKLVMTWNDYDLSGNFIGNELIVIQKAGVLGLNSSVPATFFGRDTSRFNIMPAPSLSPTTTEFAMFHNATSSNIGVLSITGVPGVSTVSFTENDFGIGSVTEPPAAAQPAGGDPSITTNDDRLGTSAWDNDHLWGSFNEQCTPPNDTTTRACLRFVSVDTGAMSLGTNFSLGFTGGDLYFAGVTLDSGDNLFAGFTASSSTLFATTVAIGVPGGNFQPVTVGDFYRTGTQAFVCGCGFVDNTTTPQERWGDYSGAARDPADTSDAWVSDQFGGIANPAGGWGTALARVTLSAPVVTGISPASETELTTCPALVTISGEEFVPGGSSVMFGSTPSPSVSVTSPESIVAVAPGLPRGTVDVTVSTTDGTSATSPADLFTYLPDTTPPVTTAIASPPPNAAGWNNSLVTVTLTASDETCGSGAASITYSATGAQAIAPTTVIGSFATIIFSVDGTTTLTYQATDNAGNVEAPNSLTIRIDTIPPSIAIGSPTSTIYGLHQTVLASYACADSGSGIASCLGTVPNGSPIDTSSLGTKVFTVQATDVAGNASSASVSYTVAYDICLLYDPTVSHHSGSTVPIKLEVCDANGVDLSSASITVHATLITPGNITPSSSANRGNNFTFDPTLGTSGGYIYLLKSTGLASGSYVVHFTVSGDSTDHTAGFVIS